MKNQMHQANSSSATGHMGKSRYGRLGWMTAFSFVAMYFLMYAMVNAADNVFMSLNQVYMAGLMAAPMLLIELVLMSAMYHNRRLNAIIAAGSVLAAVAFFLCIRRQAAIGDRQFLRSMIPHHAGAILMCQHASITDGEIKRLCQSIIASQQAEIGQMKAILQSSRN